MRVLHLETGRHLYGGARQVLLLAEGLRGRVAYQSLACTQGSELALRAEGVVDRVVEFPCTGDLDGTLLWRLRRLIRSTRASLVHIHSRRGADLWGGLAARAEGVPVVLTRRVDNPEPRWLARARYSLYDRIIAISEAVERSLLRAGAPAERLRRIPSAIDVSVRRSQGEHSCLRQELGLRPGESLVGMGAQFIPRKGHRTLLRALAILRQRGCCPRVALFGRGPLEGEIRELAAKLGLHGQVHFLGYRPELQRLLPALDLLVHPALREGMGVVVLEAASLGVPVLASRAGGLPEVLGPANEELLVPPDDPRALAQGLARLLAAPARAADLAERVRERVWRAFSPASMVSGNLCVYQELLGPPGSLHATADDARALP